MKKKEHLAVCCKHFMNVFMNTCGLQFQSDSSTVMKEGVEERGIERLSGFSKSG